MFRFYIDNVLVSEPTNWIDFTESIEFDQELKALLPKYEVKLNFVTSAYTAINDKKEGSGYCSSVVIKIDQECSPGAGYSTILNGTIYISDCRFNLNKCFVECDVTDNNYGAKIHNNKSKKAYLNVARSQNDTAITACTYDDIQVFVPTTGTYSGATTRRCYRVSDAFRFLIDFMTDNTIGFESDYLTTLTDNFGIEGLRLTTGAELRLHDLSLAPFISFQDLFHEIDIKYPLGFTVITVAGVPTIKIENIEYFQNVTESITVSNINDLQQSFNNELLYSGVKFGSTFLDYDSLQYHYPQIRFFNFADEEYHLQGECNIDKILDLTGFIISDTNLIEGCVATDIDNETYDSDLFFVQISSISLLASSSYDPVTGTLPYYYNKNLQNNFIAERHNLQGNIALYLGNADNTFRAETTVFQDFTTEYVAAIDNTTNVLTSKVFFQDDSTPPNYDTNANYNTTLYKYTSPASGSYSFENSIDTYVSGYGQLLMQVVYNVYNAANVLQRQEFCPQYNYFPLSAVGGALYSFYYTMAGSKSVYLPVGWYVTVSLSAISYPSSSSIFHNFQVLAGSYFLCSESEDGGGIYDVAVPGDYFVSRFEFDAPLSLSQYDLMKADLSKSIGIDNDGITKRFTWIRKTTRVLATSEMNWEMLSSTNNSQ